jgi:hypothetical protein
MVTLSNGDTSKTYWELSVGYASYVETWGVCTKVI